MTGYGKSVLQLPNKKITIELKSLNSKNLDLNTRLPAHYREKEIQIRRLLAKELIRGKVDLSMFSETTIEEVTTQINQGVVKQYLSQLKEINHEADLLSIAMRLPDVLKNEREQLDEFEWKDIEIAIAEGIVQLQKFRSDEGKVLMTDFVIRIEKIKYHLNEVSNIDDKRIEATRERLLKAISELEINTDENRFEQEMIYYLEKLDITEEIVRLSNHLDYFLQELESKGSNGKKLGFISQEIGREINTIGSKANFAPMQKTVVQMKDELEKIKEQLLNVL